jgi:hypothetical protein
MRVLERDEDMPVRQRHIGVRMRVSSHISKGGNNPWMKRIPRVRRPLGTHMQDHGTLKDRIAAEEWIHCVS